MEAPERAAHDADSRPGHVPVTVFWQRRAVVGLLLAALVVALAIASAAWRDRAAMADPGAVPATPGTAPATSGVPPSPAAASGSATPVPAETAAPGRAPVTCDVAQLVLRLSGPVRLKAGSEAALVVTFTNIGTDPCTLPLNASTFVLRITSGADEIWASTDCDGWGPDSLTELSPGQTLEWTRVWSRHRSDKCAVVAGELRPGTYVATATWRQGPSGRHVMTLTW